MPIASSISREATQAGAAFDRIAAQYDALFTHATIGRAQRLLVDAELARVFASGDRVLDLNCGTGEDALRLAARAIEVVACDASPAMIDVCRRKLAGSAVPLPVTFEVCANERLDKLDSLGVFDGALSNFAGLNCTADLAGVGRILARLLRPGGSLFVCLMGRTCAWEMAWRLLKGDWRRAFRRLRASGATARIGGAALRVYYPSVRRAASAFAPRFRLKSWRGVGVAVPPSWLEPWFHHRAATIGLLQEIDLRLGAWPGLRGLADHVLLHFVREEM